MGKKTLFIITFLLKINILTAGMNYKFCNNKEGGGSITPKLHDAQKYKEKKTTLISHGQSKRTLKESGREKKPERGDSGGDGEFLS